MQEIISVNNNLVKETAKLLLKKYRDKENKFLLEGFKCVDEAFKAGLNIEHVFVLKDKVQKYSFLKDKLISTNDAVLKKISDADTAPEIVAVAQKRMFSIKDIKNAKKLVLLENIKDLGNLGTILRTSVAFGAEGMILFGSECADIYNPKCVRSSVGNLCKIPFVYINSLDALCENFKNFEKVATLPRSKIYLKDFKVTFPAMVMFGSEADGLSDDLINFSTKQVKIEMNENVESLNLSVSCAVVLYKLFL